MGGSRPRSMAPGEVVRDARTRFHEWREPRPILGASLLILGGVVIGYLPVQIASELLFIAGTSTFVGLLEAIFVVFCGVGALAKPELSSLFGVAGAALATLSIFGALGGLLVGMILGTAGGVLCYAWEPPEGYGYDETTLADASEFVWGGTSEFIWQTDAASDADDAAANESDGDREP